ncbi:MAG: DUF4340 domain-containing protein [Chloroflexi bacterium]|nr:DUF4340 domain-containing protein [Chloroflexota bacterium]
MNLRLLLVLITVLSYVAIGVTWFLTNPTVEVREPEPPFFYTLSPDDLVNIEIRTGDQSTSWSLREGSRRWYFNDLEDIPADLFRWGGITQLLGGPRTQRILSPRIDDESLYGLDKPNESITVTLRDDTEVTLFLGDLTPDEESHYARIEGFPQLVLVDATWGQVLARLVTEPPLPEWYYTLSGQVREVILFNNNEVIRAYGHNRETGVWSVCDLPYVADPCTGVQLADGDALDAELEHFGNPKIGGAVALNLFDESEFEQYGTVQTAPYIAVRVENRVANNVTEVTRLTMTIGDFTDESKVLRYAVANETSDVITIDAEWAERLLELFFGEILVGDG